MKKLAVVMLIAFGPGAWMAQTTPTTAPGANPYPGTNVNSQNISVPNSNGAQVPNTISTRFNSDHPNMHPTWEMEGSNYRASYNEGTLSRTVTYDRNGNVLRRETELVKGGYPAAINDYYTKKYPGDTYHVWSTIDASGTTAYYSYRNGETFWFDSNGKYKRREKTSLDHTSSRSFTSSTGK